MRALIIPFLIAVGSVGVFSLFASIATRYRKESWSRLVMWVGILSFLGGCYLFGVTVIRLPVAWMVAAIVLFAVLFALSTGYFIARSRRRG